MTVRIIVGDSAATLKELPDESVHCAVTSPPYFGLRDYDVPGQIGLEQTLEDYVGRLVEVFREVRRVLRSDGTFWLNIGDSYANDSKWGGSTGGKHVAALHGSTGVGRGKKKTGLKPKELVGVPWTLAFALRADGWLLRQEVIWNKPNSQPEPVRDRCVSAHESLFLLTRGPRYFFDADAIAERATCNRKRGSGPRFAQGTGRNDSARSGEVELSDTRNPRSVWDINTESFRDAHFATFPTALVERCLLAGCPPGGTVLDPFGGAGTTGLVADRMHLDAILCELNPDYAAIAERRLRGESSLFAEVKVA
jgi:DNA modification methylase